MSYLLRVQLPDRPGSLGQVATALGTVGADITSVDVVEHAEDGSVIDDFLIDIPPRVMPDALVGACTTLDGVEVLYIGRYVAGGHLHKDLEALEVLAEDPHRAPERLIGLLPDVLRADWAALVHVDAAGLLHIDHGTAGAPTTDGFPATGLVGDTARQIDPVDTRAPKSWSHDALAVAPVTAAGTRLVVVGRGGPSYLVTEIARLAHLTRLAGELQQRRRQTRS